VCMFIDHTAWIGKRLLLLSMDKDLPPFNIQQMFACLSTTLHGLGKAPFTIYG
jgi:hypothetical protein